MDKDTLISRITEIGTCEDEAHRRELLTQLQDEASADYDRMTELETSNSNLTNDNEKLREANMKLFLRVGESGKGKIDPTTEPEPPKREFKDLFDEKGRIK